MKESPRPEPLAYKSETRESADIEIREVEASETAELIALDARIFQSEEPFTEAQWETFQSFWILLNGEKIGSFFYVPHKGVWEPDAELPPDQPGSLYIVSIGVLPEFQGRGLGTKVQEWQIGYAREHGFSRIVSNSRESNSAMIAVNEKLGFRKIREIPHYYGDETAVVMELRLE